MRGENFEVVISKERSRLRNLHDTGLLRFLPSVEMTGGIVEMTRGMVGMTRRMIEMTEGLVEMTRGECDSSHPP